jgi:hypothetical protein
MSMGTSSLSTLHLFFLLSPFLVSPLAIPFFLPLDSTTAAR